MAIPSSTWCCLRFLKLNKSNHFNTEKIKGYEEEEGNKKGKRYSEEQIIRI